MVKLILDTNQIVEKDWRLRSAAIRLVERAIEINLVSVVVPEIVVEEARNKFRQRLEAGIKTTKKSKSRVEKLVDAKIALQNLDVDHECTKYAEYLDHRIEELGATRPAYAGIDHEWLVKKALGPLRPFRDGDRGYRDALVWHAVVKDVASTEYDTYFVSANHKDFGDDSGNLHPHLVNDLNDVGVAGQVTYLHDLQAFVDTVVKPVLEKVPNPLTTDDFEGIFEAHVESIVDQICRGIESQGLSTVPSELFESSPHIDWIWLLSAEPVDSYALGDASMYTEFSVRVEVSFDQTVYFPDAIWIVEHWNATVTGGDEKLTELSFELTIPLTIAVVTSTAKGAVREVSVELREFFGFCPHCKDPVDHDAAEQCANCGRPLF